MDATLTLSAVQQAALIRSREISSVELVRAHLDRLAAVNPAINAAVHVATSRALASAAAADAALARGESLGAFHGVPFTVKDSLETAGTRCTAGTLGRAAALPSSRDAALVTNLQDAGAILLAKTNLPDLLFSFETDNLIFGRTNNPYDRTRTSGGSSGGEAALIAACGSPMGLGSDCAGSVRLPAAFCGIAAIKPTSGRLARAGHYPPAGGWIEALWQIGPMARYVEDLGAMMRTMAGPLTPVAPFEPNDFHKLRIAYYTDNGFAAPDAEVKRVVEAAAHAVGAEENRPACLAQAYDLEMKLIGADGGDSLMSYAESIGSLRLHPLLTGWLDKLEAYRTDLAGFQHYWAEWDAYREEMAIFLCGYDAIVCPVYTHPALVHETSIEDRNFRGFSHTMAYNLAGLPAATVRCGESADGLPIGVQVVARHWREDVALAVARALEEAFGGWRAPDLKV